jgi:endoglucanase
MKRLLWLFLLLLLVVGVPVVAQEPLAPDAIPGEVVYIPFPVDIMLDGNLDDWAGIPRITVDRGPMPSPNPSENGSFSFAVAADAETFYITMSSVDRNIITGQHGTDYWNEDSLEFYLNLSGDRTRNDYADGVFQVNINPGDIGNSNPSIINLTGVNSDQSNTRAIVFETGDGWGFEAAVPIVDYITPEHGLTVGFQAQANGASQSNRDVKLIWSNADTGDTSWSNPSVFGAGIFFEVGRKDIPLATEPSSEPASVSDRRVSINQVGYFPNAAKYGMLAGTADRAADWTLLNALTGETVASGVTSAGTFDEASGDYVQIADFSSVTTPGSYELVIDGVRSDPFQIGQSLYQRLKVDALRYFYLNRSGIPLEPVYAGEWGRAAGHMTDDAVTCWQGTDPQGQTWDGCDYLLDVRGGWYDAGDYGKYVVNGGISVWTLMNLYERLPDAFPDGALGIPESGNGISDLLDEARWEMEFLLAMQVPEGEPLAGMAHHKMHDAQWSGIPVMPPTEYDNNTNFENRSGGRYLFPPSTAATLNMAATAAQCARIWRNIDPAFSARCLAAAETAWQAANNNPRLFAGNVPGNGGGNYGDTNVEDEFYWAAAELYITTGRDAYRQYVTSSPYFTQFPNASGGRETSMNWGSTAALGTISLAMVENDLPDESIQALRNQIARAADYYLQVIDREGYRVPLGATQYLWGSNSDVLNNALVLALAYDFTQNDRYLKGAAESLDYVLGRNALSFSFVSGYGARTMQHPHHRFWGGQPQNGFPPPPPGAVAGGPNGNPSDPTALDARVTALGAAKRYVDLIGSWSTNEVTINWNAPLAWVTAYLDAQLGGSLNTGG